MSRALKALTAGASLFLATMIFIQIFSLPDEISFWLVSNATLIANGLVLYGLYRLTFVESTQLSLVKILGAVSFNIPPLNNLLTTSLWNHISQKWNALSRGKSHKSALKQRFMQDQLVRTQTVDSYGYTEESGKIDREIQSQRHNTTHLAATDRIQRINLHRSVPNSSRRRQHRNPRRTA